METLPAKRAAAGTINVAIVGLGFGAEFVPIYRVHPAVGRVAICDADAAVLTQTAERYGTAIPFRSRPPSYGWRVRTSRRKSPGRSSRPPGHTRRASPSTGIA